MIRRYGVYDAGNEIAWPALVLLDETGRVRWRFVADTYPKRLTATQILAQIAAAHPRPGLSSASGDAEKITPE